MSDQDEAQCRKLLVRVLNALDNGNYQTLAEQFAPDGVWHRQGERLEGRPAIVAALQKRPPHVVTRHLANNIEINIVSEDEATAHSVVVVYRHESDEPVKSAPMELPRSILDYDDRFVRYDGEWLLAERKSSKIFSS